MRHGAGRQRHRLVGQPRPLGPDREDVACVVPTSAFLGEGPVWCAAERRLAFVDIVDRVGDVVRAHDVPSEGTPTVDDVLAADAWARDLAHHLIGN